DYRFTKVHHIVLCGKEKIETRHWHEVKRAVYNYIIKHKPSFQISGSFRYSKDKTEFRAALTLDDGYFTESNLGASDMVRHSRKAMQAAGFDPVKDLTVGFSHTAKGVACGK
ncbi:MAG TPA: hypothetical protein PK941_06905, partial [Paludibacter sp.]|nr:hypothetical protein [Paludibacter sp.]